jgi:hypothetical protein
MFNRDHRVYLAEKEHPHLKVSQSKREQQDGM